MPVCQLADITNMHQFLFKHFKRHFSRHRYWKEATVYRAEKTRFLEKKFVGLYVFRF